MPIDPSIPLRAVQPRQRERDPIREYGNMLQISELQDQRSKRNAFEQAAQGAIGPDGQIDYGALKGAMAQSGDVMGAVNLDTTLSKRDAASRDAELGQLRVAGQRAGLMGQVFGSVRDQDSYSRGRSFMQQNGIDVSQIPEQYDPAFVADAVDQSMSAKERIDLALKERRTRAAEQGKMGANVNVNTGEQLGKPPAGWRQYRDADGTVKMERIEGGPVAEEAAEEAAKGEKSAREDLFKAENTLTAIDQVEDLSGFWSTGMAGQALGGIAGTDAYQVKALLEPIKSAIALDKMQALKALSSTGATGFGALSERELSLLTNAIASLDPGVGQDLFKDQLGKVRTYYQRWKEAVQTELGEAGTPAQTSGAPETPSGGWSIREVR